MALWCLSFWRGLPKFYLPLITKMLKLLYQFVELQRLFSLLGRAFTCLIDHVLFTRCKLKKRITQAYPETLCFTFLLTLNTF